MKLFNLQITVQLLSFIVAAASIVLMAVRFVPWNLAFKNGFFDSPEFLTKQDEMISADRQEYNVYRIITYVYTALVVMEMMVGSLSTKHPLFAPAKQITTTFKTFSF